jgi:hypothetical protein
MLYEISQTRSKRAIVIVQADDMKQAYTRAALVVETLDLDFDPLAESWTIRIAHAPYATAVFADSYFIHLHDGVSGLLH